MKTITNKFKIALAAVGLLAVGTVSAQQTSGTYAAQEKVGKSSELNGTIRVIDNKGTKKYLQVKNGLTLLTDQTPDGGIVSTWQLGGTLTDDTTITMADADSDGTSDQTFTIDGDTFTLLGTDAIDTTDGVNGIAAVADAGEPDGIANTGFTIIVRDEATGIVKKMLASDLLKVQAGQEVFTATVADEDNPTVAELTFTMAASLPIFDNVYVYRNGAKLVAGVDYTISGNTVVLDVSAPAPNDWTLYTGDVIEVHYVN